MQNFRDPILGLIGALLLALPAGEAPAAEASPRTVPNVIQSVDYASLPGGGFLIKVVLKEALKAPPPFLAQYYPGNRLSFDFPGTVTAAGREPIEVRQRGLLSLQLVQAGGRTRLVVNLDRPFAFETTLRDKELLIWLQRPRSIGARDVMKWSGNAVADAPRHGLREVGFQRGEAGAGRILVEVSDATAPVEVRRQGNSLILDFLDAQTPPHLVRRLDVQDFGTPIRAVETYRVGSGTRVKVEVAAADEVTVYQVNRQVVLAPL